MLYLSQAIGRPVLDAKGDPIGKVDDLIVAVGDSYPPVTGLVVATDGRQIFLPWSHVARFDASGARLSSATIDITRFAAAVRRDPAAGRPARQADRRHRRPARRPRQRPAPRRRRWARSTWSPSTSARPGSCAGSASRAPYRIVARNLRLPTPERYIDWEDVDPVETSIASIRLRVPHAGLTELHPADLATIIDQLAPRDRAGVLAALDDEAVADAIEEMEPETQVEVLEGLAPGARRRHPRGDVARRRGRPRRGPRPTRPARSCWR